MKWRCRLSCWRCTAGGGSYCRAPHSCLSFCNVCNTVATSSQVRNEVSFKTPDFSRVHGLAIRALPKYQVESFKSRALLVLHDEEAGCVGRNLCGCCTSKAVAFAGKVQSIFERLVPVVLKENHIKKTFQKVQCGPSFLRYFSGPELRAAGGESQSLVDIPTRGEVVGELNLVVYVARES